ncbi:AraC family transcriptional regulator [Neobacillus mesonae]|nr:AraC family transcriptional regulator [Neobacillus mesonae]
MNRGVLYTNRKLYGRLLTGISLCVAVTMLVSASIYYIYYNQFQKNQAFQNDLADLKSTSSIVTHMTETAEGLSYQIYRNTAITKLMFYPDPGVYDVTAAMLELNNYLRTMPYIESIYVNNPTSGTYYIASNREQNGTYNQEELEDTGIIGILDNYQEYKPFTPIPRTYKSSEGESISVYTFLCFDAIGRDRKLNSAVIVNLSSSWINDALIGNADNDGRTFILDDRERLMSVDSLEEVEIAPSDQDPIRARVANESSGYFVDTWKGSRSLISYSSPDQLQWQYIHVTPYKSITRYTDQIRNMTILIAGAVLGVGLFVSWLLSKRLYVPFGQVVTQKHTLEADKRNGMFTIKQHTLRNIVRVRTVWGTELAAKFNDMGISVRLDQPYRLVLLRIDYFSDFMDERGDFLLPYKFAIMNIASEVYGSSFVVESIDMDEDSVLLFIHPAMAEAAADTKETLESVIAQLQEASGEYLKISLSAVYSPVLNQPEHVHEYVRKLKEASKQRFFLGTKSMISFEEIKVYEGTGYVYPSEKELRLSELIMEGKTEEAKQLFSNIMQGTKGYPFYNTELAYSRLYVTVKNIMDHMQRRNGIELSSVDIKSLDRFETMNEVLAAYGAWFDELQDKWQEKRSLKQDDLIRRINDMIGRHYTDPNFSLNQVADELNMSSVYLGRLYKQFTLKTVGDTIQEERIAHACRLLKETDESIASISEQVGFTNSSYFYRMFKRYYGVTPTDYRKAEQNRDDIMDGT